MPLVLLATGAGDGDVRLSGGEASKLRKELADQEMLLRAYQVCRG